MVRALTWGGFLLVLALGYSAWAGKAHVHGQGELALAFEGTKGELEFRASAGDFLSFEHLPKTEAEKAQWIDFKAQVPERLKAWIQFDSSLSCVARHIKAEFDGAHGDHGHHHDHKGSSAKKKMQKHFDIEIEAKFDCAKSPLGSELTVNLSDVKALTKTKLTVIADDFQLSQEVLAEPVKVKLLK